MSINSSECKHEAIFHLAIVSTYYLYNYLDTKWVKIVKKMFCRLQSPIGYLCLIKNRLIAVRRRVML